MKRHATLALVLLAAAWPIRAQNQKEMTLSLQRDVAALQDEVKQMKAAQDEKLAVINENLRNTLDLVTRINEKMAVLQTNTSDKLNDMTRQVGAPTQALSQKVDGMNDQFLNLSNTIAELNSRIGKLDSKLEDIKKMVQTIPANQAPPQNTGNGNGGPQATNTGGGGTTSTAPAISGEKLFDDANRDYLAGNTDLALQGFTDYLKNFADSQRAPDAQFFIAEIYSRKEDFDNAVTAYDAVITNYPDSSRVPNAHYMKGVALVKTGRRADAAREFKIVVEKYPSNELAKKAKDYLKILGVPVSQVPAQKKRH
ncbi:MAG TPA: tetratricopeptide repeat protein [Bryobacteraceae bacterium]|jgi:tol-pal system protein YbgF